MTFASGTHVGPYRIVSRLGAGGMGEVYLAEDTRLHRRVALKVVNALVADELHARDRLMQEAKAAAALDHPNICTVFDVGEADGCTFIVVQYVEGETLDRRMRRGPLAAASAVAIARQVADALAEAHRHGIVHRDVKPQNIMVSPHGHVRVLDFGLAKITGPADSVETSPRLTATGMIAGTLPYMSPEQLRGESTDARTDIFSFGTMLCEMVTGAHPFAAGSGADTTSAILNRDVVLPVAAGSPELARIIRKCLEKDREHRYQTTKDLAVDLDAWSRQPTRAASVRRRPAVRVWVATASLLVLAAAVLLDFWWRAVNRPPVAPTALAAVQLTDFPDSAAAPVLSRDGRAVAFLRGGTSFLSSGDVYVKMLPNGEPIRLTDDRRLKYGLAFSPDGRLVAYTMLENLSNEPSRNWNTWTVPVTGGEPPTRLLPNAAGLSWIDDHHVLFSEIQDRSLLHMGLVTASESRAAERMVYLPVHERGMAHYSYLSPDRQWVLVVEMNGSGFFGQCRLLPFDGQSSGREVGPAGACLAAAWSPDGRTMYFNAAVHGVSHLWRQRFPDGAPEIIAVGPGSDEEGLAVAPDGRSLVTSIGRSRSALWIHDGSGERLLSTEGWASEPRLSRDGKRLYFLWRRQTAQPLELSVMDVSSGRIERLMLDHEVTDYDVSPDDTTVAFSTPGPDGVSEVWVAALDRRTAPHRVVRAADSVGFAAGGNLVFRALEGHVNYVDRVSLAGTGRRRLSEVPVDVLENLSPDGAWQIVEVAGVEAPGSGLPRGVVLALPTAGGQSRVVCAQSCFLSWSRDGRWLYGSVGYKAPETAAIPLMAGAVFPSTTPGSADPLTEWKKRSGTRILPHGGLAPGSDPDTYVFTKATELRNLFQIPIS